MNEFYQNFLVRSNSFDTDYDLINNLKGNWTNLIIMNSYNIDIDIKVTFYFILENYRVKSFRYRQNNYKRSKKFT